MQDSTNQQSAIKLNKLDNVIIALEDFNIGDDVDILENYRLNEKILRGHKIAAYDIKKGENIIRYGQIIGIATKNIAFGDHVHSHNCGMGSHIKDYGHASNNQPLCVASEQKTFQGFHRENGHIGTRNYIGIITSVNCSATVARFIANEAEKSSWFAELKNVDGIVAITYSGGCGMSGDDEGYQTLKRTLIGYGQNSNFAAILLLGLGCEVMQISELASECSVDDDKIIQQMTIQDVGGSHNAIQQGIKAVQRLAIKANKYTRQPSPISELVIGMQCGSSDGLSGITANPALGIASDLIVSHGGTTILSETSEIYGAEHLLTRRAATENIGKKLIERIKWWENYTAKNDSKMDNNPTPGNKLGGLTTILEKSLGAVAKGGNAPLVGIYKYAEKLDNKGFVFMDSPGYDPCSVTGQIASGANLICFTTGRGSVSGYKPSPCIKISSNDELYTRLRDDIDINCGDIISQGINIEEKGRQIFEKIISVASGEETKSEALGFGDMEFVPWHMGAVV